MLTVDQTVEKAGMSESTNRLLSEMSGKARKKEERKRSLHFHFYLFLRVGVGLDMRSIHVYHFRGQVSRFCHFLQDPCKYRIYRFGCVAVPEVVAHRGEMQGICRVICGIVGFRGLCADEQHRDGNLQGEGPSAALKILDV